MKFTLRQLELYISLSDTLQISKAASRCHISQSSMTVAMRNLEHTLNAQLFIRHSRGIQLTAKGERFLMHARKILTDTAVALQDLHSQPVITTGHVRIGVAETLSAYLLPTLLRDIETRFPLLDVSYQEAPPSQLVKSLRQEELDFCLLLTSNMNHEEDMEAETLLRSLRQLWTGIGHPLLTPSTLRLSDIEKVPFILLVTDDYSDVMTEHWRQRGCQPAVCFRTRSFEAVRSMVAQGRGVTMLSDLVYRQWSLDGLRIVQRPVDDCMTYMDVGIVKQAVHKLSPASQQLVDFLRQLIPRLANK